MEVKSIAILGGLSLLAIFIISYFATSIFNLPAIKAGPIIYLLLIAATVLLLFNVATKKNFDFSREDIFVLVLVTGAIVAVFYFLPQLTPQYFSIIALH